ncbi:MBL fold metallo-hydrolase [Abyssisolibacter fermentans]|uniref:MBL fold metallo-hydrolase n=1 Tax=Abyssisolibacter fermentans TaxID=1766203 RepID=UPI000830074D|nr:MBL fold metallo-hydrolase [Abyssisolibacter fermentans]
MSNNKNITIKRYNIYSGLEIKINDMSICVDPAKIVPNDLKLLNPDIILISHESMDHMDPTQVYRLQKRRNCKIFCSVAVAVDLTQYYAHDVDFIDSINVLIPGSEMVYRGVKIIASKSVHCDYMLPLVFRLDFLEYGFSILHCIDTLLSREIEELSKGTDISIIPIGIAKGVSAELGLEFISKLKSSVYITNHFTNQLEDFSKLIEEKNIEEKYNAKIMSLDWNEECYIPESYLSKKDITIEHLDKFRSLSLDEIIEILDKKDNLEDNLRFLIAEINLRKGELLQEKLLQKLEEIYKTVNKDCKMLILLLFVMVSLFDSALINENFVNSLKEDLLLPTAPTRDEFKAALLFFLGTYCQQNSSIYNLDEIIQNIDINHEHVSYWVVECLGRMGVSKHEDCMIAIEALREKIVSIDKLFNSVVVRRKIFWEFHRLTRLCPTFSKVFVEYFDSGLKDFNPDVRLLAILCIGVLSRTNNIINKELIGKMVELDNDVEDDVRETLARIFGVINRYYHQIAVDYKEKIETLLNDKNCHVRRAARDTLREMAY